MIFLVRVKGRSADWCFEFEAESWADAEMMAADCENVEIDGEFVDQVEFEGNPRRLVN